MEEYRHPIHAAEPFEESQGRDDSLVSSPEALAAFYQDMERKEIVERKLSKKLHAGTSLWARKSLKRSGTAQSAPPPVQGSHQPQQSIDRRDEQRREDEERIPVNHEDANKPDWILPMNSPRSIIPDSRDLPTTHNKDAWKTVPLSSDKSRYLIHNPLGPRWYKNHHLIPPSETTPSARPPSFFSPSFPPIASASQDRLEDSTRIAGPSRTPSNSPLPTPNSSQTRVEDRPRTRKLSETAHDVVDLLDVTDPWGTNWHHRSPYDIGLVGPISADVQDVLHTRTRRSSMDQIASRTVVPSPLSQSMSAIDLQVKNIQVPRKLSKRRTAPPPSRTQERGLHQTASLPTTPLETRPSASDLPKRMSVAAAPVGSSMAPPATSKKEKRGSVLGRLAKKFGFLTRSSPDPVKPIAHDDNWQLGISQEPALIDAPSQYIVQTRQPSPQKPPSLAPKRVPPPSVEEPPLDATAKEVDSSSIASLEPPYSIGRLTVANPDTSTLDETTPAQGPLPLPPTKESLSQTQSPPQVISPLMHHLGSSPPALPDKDPRPATPPTKPCEDEISEVPVTSSFFLPQPFAKALQQSETRSENSKPPDVSSSVLSIESLRSVHGSDAPGPSPAHTRISLMHTPSPAPPLMNTISPQPSSIFQPSSSTVRPTSVFSSVPFPSGKPGEDSQSLHVTPSTPLSAASILANPPTPYTDADKVMLVTPNNPPPPLPSTHSVEVPARQTETFRLIRSPSGNVYASNDMIVAGGEHWEVVGSEKMKKKVSPSSKEQASKESTSKPHQVQDRRYRDPDAMKDGDDDSKNRDHRRSARVRDSKEKDHVLHSRDRDYDRDTRDREHIRESRNHHHFRDKEHHRDSKEEYHHNSREKERYRVSKEKEHHRDSREKEHHRDSREKEHHRYSRGKDYPRDLKAKDHHDSRGKDHRDSREKEHHRDSREKDYDRESREKMYPHRSSREKEYTHAVRDSHHARYSRDQDQEREHIRDSRDKESFRDSRDRDASRDYKSRDSRDRSHRDREKSGRSDRKHESSKSYPSHSDKDSRQRQQSRGDSNSSEPERLTQSSSRGRETDNREPTISTSLLPHDPKASMLLPEDKQHTPTQTRLKTFPTSLSVDPFLPVTTAHLEDTTAMRPLARHPSLSTRPTSQIPSADEINAMRAKEAWDMERLWKARSMQGDEFTGFATVPTIPSNHNTPLMPTVTPPAVSNPYGSSHTAFVVQTPPQHSIYHSMPAVPPPIIYSSSSSIPTVAHQVPLNSHRQTRSRIYTDSVASDQKSYISARMYN
ncbi:hypothetical protein H0H93_014177 [Arthromyces matolae]|nr:hypothetical protein H0H93_014177 [Arthromyces matolae]